MGALQTEPLTRLLVDEKNGVKLLASGVNADDIYGAGKASYRRTWLDEYEVIQWLENFFPEPTRKKKKETSD